MAILGAGPIGLEAALYARYLGYETKVFERGRIAENVLRWGHVQMFSPFQLNCSPLGLAALRAQDADYCVPVDVDLLTGHQWAERYLIPLSRTDLLTDCLCEQTMVVSIGRQGLLKGDGVGTKSRHTAPFRIVLRDGSGKERTTNVDIIIDATGTYGNHNWMGDGGVPAAGEIESAERIDYELPDIAGAKKDQYAGRHTLLVGAGYSAATSAMALAELARQVDRTRVTWITRCGGGGNGPVPRVPQDRLSARDRLAIEANRRAAGNDPNFVYWPNTTVDAVTWDRSQHRFNVALIGQNEGRHWFDGIVANVGYRPDRRLYEELQVHECYASGGPMKLAAVLLGQVSTDCLNQSSAGAETLLSPEPNFFVLGSKSYGRNSRFLFAVGLEQIRDVFTIIGGRTDLDLYQPYQE